MQDFILILAILFTSISNVMTTISLNKRIDNMVDMLLKNMEVTNILAEDFIKRHKKENKK